MLCELVWVLGPGYKRKADEIADGVIAHEGRWLGAQTFVSFDRKAVKHLAAQGRSSRLLS